MLYYIYYYFYYYFYAIQIFLSSEKHSHYKLLTLRLHHSVRQKYGNKPYYFHLKQVYDIVKRYTDDDTILIASLFHDSIEDARLTFNDVKKLTYEQVANIVYAVTNEKGRNREERANKKYYEEINNCIGADLLKIADRYANMRNSKKMKPKMFKKYMLENDEFVSHFGNNDGLCEKILRDFKYEFRTPAAKF
jgi:(p)ppGpp synthase/HD superfamily hydrolase